MVYHDIDCAGCICINNRGAIAGTVFNCDVGFIHLAETSGIKSSRRGIGFDGFSVTLPTVVCWSLDVDCWAAPLELWETDVDGESQPV